jgi:Putative Ig domain
MPLRVTNCTVSNNSITIAFSDPVDSNATTPANYTVFDPGSVDFSQPQTLDHVGAVANFTSDAANTRLVTINFTAGNGAVNEFQNGDWVHITIKGVTASSGAETLEGGQLSFARQVPGKSQAERATRDVEDAVTYPLLTEQVTFPRSGGGPTTGVSSSPGGAALGQTAALAIGDILGWKVSGTDPKGFVGALTQAFTLTDVEGHVEASWNPRTYAVQTDLGGGITGAQASLYTRAKDALDQSLSLLDGLYPLDPDADPEYVKALREMARSQMTEIVREFGVVGLPSILRIDTYFEILLGQHPIRTSTPIQFDPDQIKGTLGQLRDSYGIYFRGNPFNNSIEDEQDITNFRVISDYMTSLLQSWIANREFFIVSPNRVAFFGTQLVLISRQLNVIAETVDEVRFALDSVFIGPNERQTLLLKFSDHALPPMFLEDVLEEIETFVKGEGPRLLRDGGKISVTNNILPVVRSLRHMVEQAHDPENRKVLPDGFKTARVRHSLDDLQDQLGELIKLTEQVEQQVPIPEGELKITAVSTPQWVNGDLQFSVLGQGMHPAARTHLHSDGWSPVKSLEFFSAERVDVTIDSTLFKPGRHDIRVTNPDGESATHAVLLPTAPIVSPPVARPVSIVTTSLPDATVGSFYSQTLQATGGTAPYNWTLIGNLPAGLNLTAGVISGAPAQTGTYNFSVTVTDAGGSTAAQPLSIMVDEGWRHPVDRLSEKVGGLENKIDALEKKIVHFFEGKGRGRKGDGD